MKKKHSLNKAWHLKNKMPLNASDKRRAEWHIEHSKNCNCREMTPAIRKLVEKYKN